MTIIHFAHESPLWAGLRTTCHCLGQFTWRLLKSPPTWSAHIASKLEPVFSLEFSQNSKLRTRGLGSSAHEPLPITWTSSQNGGYVPSMSVLRESQVGAESLFMDQESHSANSLLVQAITKTHLGSNGEDIDFIS